MSDKSSKKSKSDEPEVPKRKKREEQAVEETTKKVKRKKAKEAEPTKPKRGRKAFLKDPKGITFQVNQETQDALDHWIELHDGGKLDTSSIMRAFVRWITRFNVNALSKRFANEEELYEALQELK